MSNAGSCGQQKVDVSGRLVYCPRPRAYAVVQEAGADNEFWTIAKSAAPLYCASCATLVAWERNREIRRGAAWKERLHVL